MKSAPAAVSKAKAKNAAILFSEENEILAGKDEIHVKFKDMPNLERAGEETNIRWFAKVGSCVRVIGAGRWYVLSPSNVWCPLFYMCLTATVCWGPPRASRT